MLEKQWKFTELLGRLITYAYSKGYKLTLGDGYRADGKGHMPGSLHYSRLAQDLNLFIASAWIKKYHPAWEDLGAYWKSLDPECGWGGDFAAKDYNHFSLKHGGKA